MSSGGAFWWWQFVDYKLILEVVRSSNPSLLFLNTFSEVLEVPILLCLEALDW